MNVLLLGLILLILVGGMALIIILFVIASRRNVQRAVDTRERMETALEQGTLASAELVSARTTFVREGDAVNLVRVTLKVTPPTGEEYLSINTWEVKPEAMSVLQPGQTLAVIIDRGDPKKVSPNFSGARLSLAE